MVAEDGAPAGTIRELDFALALKTPAGSRAARSKFETAQDVNIVKFQERGFHILKF
jgi:hypothetical protein